MAHKRLKGMGKKQKLAGTRKHVKVKKKNQIAAGEGEAGKKPQTKQDKKAAAANRLQKNGRPMNKKEEKQAALLQRMHRNLYAGNERVLLVGEGNFSFTHALCRHLGSGSGIYGTSLDKEADLYQKYPDAAGIRKKIEDSFGGTCLTGVDATRLHKIKEFRGAFRKIIFNFPHIGGGEKDVDKNIMQHRQLLAAFFTSAVKCLDPEHESSIHVALKSGEPYKSWKIVPTVRAACPELDLQTVVPFIVNAWEGYSHRRTAGFDERFSRAASEELSEGAKVYVFRKRKGEGDDDDDDE